MPIRLLQAKVLFLIILGLSSCSPFRLIIPTRSSLDTLSIKDYIGSKNNPFLKIHMGNGMVYILSEWGLDEEEVHVLGKGKLFGINRKLISDGEFNIPITQISLAESNTLMKAINPLSVMTIFSLGGSAACLSMPKLCFGSCPTFYITDGDSLQLMAEGFSLSTTPLWEDTDVDALFLADPNGPEVHLRVTNEAQETHAIKSVRLLAFPKEKERRVIKLEDDHYFSSRMVVPSSCVAEEGDILPKIIFFDNDERYTVTDEFDLTAKEYIEVSFDEVEKNENALVLGFRQTIMATFVYYTMLDYMGDTRGDGIAKLIREDKVNFKPRERILDALGGIEVQMLDQKGHWSTVETVYEAGPIAKDVIGIRLPPIQGEEIRIRLEMTKGMWRLDYLALAGLEKELEPLAIEPYRIEDSNGNVDNYSLELLLDPDRYLTTLLGDKHDIFFPMPDEDESFEWFLESRGYYLEWHRDAWLVNRDMVALLELQLQPKRALKKMASMYKDIEEEFEDLFWNSRYEMDHNY